MSFLLWVIIEINFNVLINCLLNINTNNYLYSMYDWSGGRSNKTFKPKKNIPEGTHQYDLMKQAAATLGSGNLRLAVMLPEGEDLNEWVAVNSNIIFYIYFSL
jgi:hypothetical protein